MGAERVNLKLDRSGVGRIKVVWSDASNAPYPPYHLVTDWIAEKVVSARTELAILGQVYRHQRPDFEPTLAALARCGHFLRLALFEDVSPEDRANAHEARDWFEGMAKGPLIINVNADPILPVPWGILHEGPEAVEDDIYQGFWGPRFEVVAIYNGMRPLPGARSNSDIKLLVGLNQDVFENVQKSLNLDDQKMIEALLERPVGKALTVQGCRERWKQVGNNDCIIYFFGHATRRELQFGPTPEARLSVSGFRSLFRRENTLVRNRSASSQILTILNGCTSSAGQDSESFLLATADPGFCGFIGAEAEVPDQFGVLFGHELLCALLDERLSVRNAMVRLWRKHRPLGLLYGCYAHPNYIVAASGGNV